MLDFLAKLKNLIRFARITGAADNLQQFPVQQMEYKGKVVNVFQIFPYGIYANVSSKDGLGVMFSVDGNPDNRAAISFTPQKRPDDLEEDEVAMYHPYTESFIKFRNNGDVVIDLKQETPGNIIINCVNSELNADDQVEINCADATINASASANVNCSDANIAASSQTTIDTPETTITGNVQIDGNLNVDGDTTLSENVTSDGTDISNSHQHTQPNTTSNATVQGNTGAPI